MIDGLLICLLVLGQLVLYFSNVVRYLFESIWWNGGFRARLSPDTVNFDCHIVDFLLVLCDFLWVFNNFCVEAVSQINYSLLGFWLELLDFFIELVIILCILCLIFLSQSLHFKDDWPQLFNLFFTLLVFVVFVVSHLIIQKFFIVLDTRL